jgi:hypothetical protein
VSELEQQVADQVAAGRITADDAAAVLTFRDYLRDLSTRETDRDAWRAKWAAYAGGLADGPTTPEEFESIRAERRAGGTGDRGAKP